MKIRTNNDYLCTKIVTSTSHNNITFICDKRYYFLKPFFSGHRADAIGVRKARTDSLRKLCF